VDWYFKRTVWESKKEGKYVKERERIRKRDKNETKDENNKKFFLSEASIFRSFQLYIGLLDHSTVLLRNLRTSWLMENETLKT
jgi:hypothetical protein